MDCVFRYVCADNRQGVYLFQQLKEWQLPLGPSNRSTNTVSSNESDLTHYAANALESCWLSICVCRCVAVANEPMSHSNSEVWAKTVLHRPPISHTTSHLPFQENSKRYPSVLFSLLNTLQFLSVSLWRTNVLTTSSRQAMEDLAHWNQTWWHNLSIWYNFNVILK